MTKRKHSALYRHIEKLQGERSWGSFLDAGSGIASMRWLTSLNTSNWTAITGSESHAQKIRQVSQPAQRPGDELILSNWMDPLLLKDRVYDTVMADYLLGAIEGFAPYFQPFLFQRLRPLTKQRLYITGREPYVPLREPSDKAGKIVWEIGRHRDACVLLAGDRPYREYPVHWVIHHVERAGFKVLSVKHFKINAREKFINSQIDLSKIAIQQIADKNLAKALDDRGEAIREEALKALETEGGTLRTGEDYVIEAQPV